MTSLSRKVACYGLVDRPRAPTLTVVGVGLMVTAVLLLWALYPRQGEEARAMSLPGAWIFVPLLIIFCLIGGGSLVYTFIGK
ncbi:MAG: hypothetical protein HC868_15060 [Sphingomonadales bacterium]|nr:hypothetical protein [Sphingomonadales bacterium]